MKAVSIASYRLGRVLEMEHPRVSPCLIFFFSSWCFYLSCCRPNMEKTGQVSESGSSTVKHALNPDKSFLQVHYLKVRN